MSIVSPLLEPPCYFEEISIKITESILQGDPGRRGVIGEIGPGGPQVRPSITP